MNSPGFCAHACRGSLVRLCLLFLVAAAPRLASADTAAPVAFPISIKPVEQAPPGPLNRHRPLITRNTLKAEELAAPLDFEIALKTRNIAELRARVAKGERISPAEMAARYEPLPADYDTVARWLSSQGFTVTRHDPRHLALFARGSVARIQSVFSAVFARVTFEGAEYTSAVTPPHLPASIAPAVLSINGLQPHIRAHKHIMMRPGAALLSGSATYFPQQIADAYDAAGLYSGLIQGSGQTIAIVIDTFPAPSDLVSFWAAAGIPQSLANIQFIQVVPGTLPQPSGEETLDTEWSSSIAPAAHVRVYAATALDPAYLDQVYSQVYDDVTAYPSLNLNQMSMSYGIGEQYTTLGQVQTDDSYFMELTAVGVSIFASSGDSGSTPGPGGAGDESGPIQVLSPASDPYVTGVGGTTLILSTSNSVNSETVWNEDGGASGGGFSEYFPRPSWQSGIGVSTAASGTFANGARQVPDIAAPADPDFGAIIFLSGSQQTVGGTSWASPTCAGFCALINNALTDAAQPYLGQLNLHLYPLLGGTNYTSYFRDITTGNNATPRSSGAYSATVGYDLCTGLGAPLVQPLANLLAGPNGLIGVTLPPFSVDVVPGENATISIGIAGSSSASFQWQRKPVGSATWLDLSDVGSAPYSGSAAPTLNISSVTTAMSGDQFRCMATINDSQFTTPPSTLVVDNPWAVSTFAGQVGVPGRTNATGTSARFDYPSGVAVDGSGNVYVADFSNNQIRKITPAGVVSTPYGNINGFSGNGDGTGNNAFFSKPNGIAVDGSGNIYVADTGNNEVREISGGYVTTIATGFSAPLSIAVDGSGNIYVANSGDNTIRITPPGGSQTIFAGVSGTTGGYSNGPAYSAQFNDPMSVAVDTSGNVYVADAGNNVVREISNGVVSTIAGQAGVAGWQDGLGAGALFNNPIGLATDGTGNLYITDSQIPPLGVTTGGNNLLRRLSPAGVVSTLAGNTGIAGAFDGTGSGAEFYSLQAVCVSASTGAIYLADTYNQTIRFAIPGNAVPTRVISLSGDLSFGDVEVGDTSVATMTISNSGNSTLNVSNITFPFGFSGDWTAGVIDSGSSQNVNVTFSPLADESYGGSILLFSNATSGPNSLAVSGTGVPVSFAPSVSTSAATEIGDDSATLNAQVDPGDGSTAVYFQYGLTGTYGSTSSSTNAGDGSVYTPVSVSVAGLIPGMLYHYRAVASNSNATVSGSDETFTTAAFETTRQAATGDSAAGVAGAAFSSFGNPAINPLDYLAFQATLSGSVSSINNVGIWAADSSGNRYLVARSGSAAVGAGGAVFEKFSNPVYNSAESVAFVGTLKNASGLVTSKTATGIWLDSAGSLALLAREGSPAPGSAGATFRTFSALALPDQGGPIFLATLSNGHQAIFSGTSSATLEPILSQGSTAGGKTIKTLAFLPSLPYVSGQSRSFSQSTGNIACLATFTDKSTGILLLAGTASAPAALTGSDAPGLSGAKFSAFGNPVINANNQVAFHATLAKGAGGISTSNSAGIWAGDGSGALRLIEQSGSAAPGASAVFKSFSDPVYNDNQAVAFRALLKTAPNQATGSTAAGLWSNSSGALTLIARQGSQAPDCPTGATFKSFTAYALPDQGGAIFLATLNTSHAAGVTAVNNTGIWAVDTSNNLRLVVRTGASVGGKTVRSLSFLPVLAQVPGQSRNFVQTTGDLVYQAIFSDGTSALFTVSFP